MQPDRPHFAPGTLRASIVIDDQGRLLEVCPQAMTWLALHLSQWQHEPARRWLPEVDLPPTHAHAAVHRVVTSRGHAFEARVTWSALAKGKWAGHLEPLGAAGEVNGLSWVEVMDRFEIPVVVGQWTVGDFQAVLANSAARASWNLRPGEVQALPAELRQAVEPLVHSGHPGGAATFRDREGISHRLVMAQLQSPRHEPSPNQWLLVDHPHVSEVKTPAAELVEAAGVALLNVDPTGRIRWANPLVESFLGLPVLEAVGRDFARLLEDSAPLVAAIRTRKPLVQAFRVAQHAGAVEWVQVHLVPLADAPVAGFGVTLVDLTRERLAVEEVRRMGERAAQVDRARDEFVANISHEVRTPMNGMLGLCRLLTESDLGPVEQDYARSIERAASNLLEVLDAMLDFTRLRSGQAEVSLEPFGVVELVDDVLALLGPEGVAKGLRVRAEVAPSVCARLRSDPLRVRQILSNLVSNALRFTQQGDVVVRISQETTRTRGTVVKFVVHDTGIGIAADRQDAIFESFVQADGGSTRRFGGTGLGLAISRQLAHLLDGEITVTSELGVGSCFTLSLPAPMGEPSVAEAWPHLSGQPVLLATARAGDRRDLGRLLRALGGAVREVTTLAQVRQCLQDRPGAWVVMEPNLDDWADAPAVVRQSSLAPAGRCLCLGEPEGERPPNLVTTALPAGLGHLRRWLAASGEADGARRAAVWDERPSVVAQVRRSLEEHGYSVTVAVTLDAMAEALKAHPYHLVVVPSGLDVRRRHLADRARRRAAEAGLEVIVVAMIDGEQSAAPWADHILTKMEDYWAVTAGECAGQTARGFDAEALARATDGDAAFAQELVEGFRARVDQLVVRWPALLAEDRLDEVAHEAEEFQMSCEALGAMALVSDLHELRSLLSGTVSPDPAMAVAALRRFIDAAQPYRPRSSAAA